MGEICTTLGKLREGRSQIPKMRDMSGCKIELHGYAADLDYRTARRAPNQAIVEAASGHRANVNTHESSSLTRPCRDMHQMSAERRDFDSSPSSLCWQPDTLCTK